MSWCALQASSRDVSREGEMAYFSAPGNPGGDPLRALVAELGEPAIVVIGQMVQVQPD